MAEALAKTEVSESSLAIAGSCHMPRRMCWMALEHAPAGPLFEQCRFRTVVTASAPAMLAIGPAMVRDWEAREGGVMDDG